MVILRDKAMELASQQEADLEIRPSRRRGMTRGTRRPVSSNNEYVEELRVA
jgi:hypothetical protein